MITSGRYRHYKGRDYEVIGLAKHSETEEIFVIYRALYGACELWARPVEMFTEKVMIDGIPISRFERIKEADEA
jgi:hypothetical protein